MVSYRRASTSLPKVKSVYILNAIISLYTVGMYILMLSLFVKPGTRGLWPCAPGFLKSFCPRTSVCLRVCVWVCPPPRPLITSHVKGMRNNWIMKFYGYSVSLYDTTIDKFNSPSLSNNAGRECLLKMSQVMRY